jgi:hypothetical protein
MVLVIWVRSSLWQINEAHTGISDVSHQARSLVRTSISHNKDLNVAVRLPQQ